MSFEEGIIEVDPRHTLRSIRSAIQGDVIRALVELITNSDDSYIRLEGSGVKVDGKIEISYKKDGYSCFFAVRDFAEGMSLEEIRNNFRKYGTATSGLKEGNRVRGYFGQGAKDALASMIDGRICSFKNDVFIECQLFIEDKTPKYRISEPIKATDELRKFHKIYGNGTVAYFKADPNITGRVPQFNTIHESLANNYLLRKIMTNPQRQVILIDENSGKSRRLRFMPPEGKEILSEEFILSTKYGDFPVTFSLWRAERELSQSGDDRLGGILIVDAKDVVLGISLFKFDNEPLASHFFGEARISNFRDLLIKEEPVLKDDRSGLDTRHPFCQKLILELEKRLGEKVEEERKRRQREESSIIDREENQRFRKAISILNEIATLEAESPIFLGPMGTIEIVEPPNGLYFYPQSAHITVGKRYAFELRINTRMIGRNSTIKITSTNSKIVITPQEITIPPEEKNEIIQKYITVEGKEPNIEGIISAQSGKKLAEARVFVVPDKDLFVDAMKFEPETLTLRPNKVREVYLLVYIKKIEGGSKIILSSDNAAIHISEDEIFVNEAEATRHIFKYKLEIWGEGEGQEGMIIAECEYYSALLEVKIRGEEKLEPRGAGMFSEPEFSFEDSPLQRTSYSSVTGKITIYVNFPSIKLYLGENCQYRKTLPAQVLIADLIAERCFFEIAKKKVESTGMLLRPEAKADRIQRDALELSSKYGEKVHKALVDQNLLNEAKRQIDKNKT